VKKFVLFDLFEALEPLGVLLLHLLHNVRLRFLLACLKREQREKEINFFIGIEVLWIQIRIQHFRRNTDPDPDPIRIRIQSGSRVFSKNLQLKIFFFLLKQQFTYPWAFIKDSKLQKKPSGLKREHPALQKMKFINFFIFFGVIFALLDLDRDPGTPIEFGSNPDPGTNQQH
jgi:hypothetical protein